MININMINIIIFKTMFIHGFIIGATMRHLHYSE